ncbi:MAG: ABC transporter permease subunit [Pseudomonadota bacterium]
MAAYILRRLALIPITLLGILALNFAIIQFAPGGPIEQIIAELDNQGDVNERLRTSGDPGAQTQQQVGGDSSYRGSQGLDPVYLARLEVEFNFARIVCADGYEGPRTVAAEECVKEPIPLAERFLLMLIDYATFDLGESFFQSEKVTTLVFDKLPVSISLGLWSTLLSYLVSIPLGITKAVRDGSPFDAVTSAVVIAAYAIPGFLFAVILLVLFAGESFLPLFPLRGLTSDNFDELSLGGQILDYFWHIALPVTAMTISGFAVLTLLTKNSFLDEIRKQYVMTARAKGLSERRVLYGHVFRNAMLIVIAGFPGAFLSIFFSASVFVETVFSLDGLGLLGFEAVLKRDYPIVFGTLFMFGLLGLVIKLIGDLTYVLVDPRIDFERREG